MGVHTKLSVAGSVGDRLVGRRPNKSVGCSISQHAKVPTLSVLAGWG
ncbi:MAG: hypothetical protein KA716_05730 [Gloeotrichia echinulata DEX184]|nr:hypothetical protein [Gloeotrichia echinulata DEX184]